MENISNLLIYAVGGIIIFVVGLVVILKGVKYILDFGQKALSSNRNIGLSISKRTQNSSQEVVQTESENPAKTEIKDLIESNRVLKGVCGIAAALFLFVGAVNLFFRFTLNIVKSSVGETFFDDPTIIQLIHISDKTYIITTILLAISVLYIKYFTKFWIPK